MKKIYFCVLLSTLLCKTGITQTGSVNLVPPNGTATSYASISAAYAAIPTPLTGNYLIEFTAAYSGASETFPIQLTDKGLTAGGYNITVRPIAGNANSIIQRPVATAGAVLQFNGADNVILDGRPGGITSNSTFYLTINDTYSGGSANRNIELLNGANNNIIRYVNSFAAAATSDGGGSRNILVGSGSATLGGNNKNTITNCVVNGGLRGIQDFGLSATVVNSGTIISNDSIRAFGAIGIFAGSNQNKITIQNNYVGLNSYNVPVTGTSVSVTGIQQQSLAADTSNILNNTISLVSTSTSVSSLTAITDLGTGIENITGNNIIALSTPSNTAATTNFIVGLSFGLTTGGGVSTFNISRNKIAGLSSTGAVNFRGISGFPGTGSIANISNNFISIMDPNTSASVIFGLLLGTATGVTSYTSNIYYNSVRIGGSEDASSTTSAYGIYKGDANTGSVYNQRNNISIVERTGGGSTAAFIGFYLASTAGTNTVNYNTYYAADATNGYAAGGWDGSIYHNAGLTTYKSGAAPQEQNSNFATVTFVSNTDLHLASPSNTAATLVGTPITGYTVDIDGQPRSATVPYQGADEPVVPTPIQLLSFMGEAKVTYNILHWQTANEQNNSGFYLERSVDGKNFTTLAFIKSKAINGNSSASLEYTFDDIKPLSSKGFYRLRQVDLDGKNSYSSIVVLSGKTPLALSISSVYPNPVVNVLNLVMKTPVDTKVMLNVIDASGKTVIQQSTTLKTGDNYLSVATGALASGIYTLSVTQKTTGEVITSRFVK